jgi:tripartite-type tricarboxylate transporter receptor subunit TctC
MKNNLVNARVWLATGLIIYCATQHASAQPVAEFYRGKSLDLIIPTSSGGDYDLRARLIARHLGRFIPGNPTIVARNMSGGVGMQAANYMAGVANKDGTVLHAIYQNMPILQAIGSPSVRYDVRKFGWIGSTTKSPNLINSWHTSGVTKISDVIDRELVIGSSGAASPAYVYPSALNKLVGTKFKIITGYPGGNDVNLAMEKGEVFGRGSNSLASWESGHPHWIAEKKIHFLVQVGLERSEKLPDVPLLYELATTDADRAVLKFISSDMPISRAIVTTPDVPPERLHALRSAFDAMVNDSEFLAEAAKSKMDISPTTGAEAQRIATDMIEQPAEIISQAKRLLDGTGK